jgi:hypothetical protein
MNPQTALEAAAWRRLPASRWPWRSAWYLLATLPAALMAALLLAVPAVPWLVLAGGRIHGATIGLLILLGCVLVAALGPLIAIPVAATARRRLAIVDRRPAEHAQHMPGADGVRGWLHALVPRAAHDDDLLAALHSRMGGAAFEQAWTWGRSLGGSRAIEYALQDALPDPIRPEGLPRAGDAGAIS